jgi:hypothetical protein
MITAEAVLTYIIVPADVRSRYINDSEILRIVRSL